MRQAMATLIHRCTEIAGTVNNDHSAFLEHQGNLGAVQERVDAIAKAIQEIEDYLNASRAAVNDRFTIVENTCTEVAKTLVANLKLQYQDMYTAVEDIQKAQHEHALKILDGSKGVEYAAEALYKVNDAQNRIEALEKKVALLEEQNKALQASCDNKALALAASTPSSAGRAEEEAGFATMAARLEARIEAYQDATAKRNNTKINNLVHMFEKCISASIVAA
jgi:chromosome segregation ATPase